ncbi:DUF4283 domain-containing protein [Cephalotus follicularis]|uniref:DUF4283 domain-containing protein n=1 Tax=Cephalotus follicularis TaxID=3775 RepID=A0A1Q3D6W3_CEPFO|nr:DUF4283 domain-containing protein [Cephalotus follicularis]
MSLKLEDCNSIPIWVKLSKIPVHFWKNVGLSFIRSVLGKPFNMDTPIASMVVLSYTRVCIDMPVSNMFPGSILLEMEDGTTTLVEVECPWKLVACTLCRVFDHLNKSCPKVVRREWMLKPMVEARRKSEDAKGWIAVKRKNLGARELIQAPKTSSKGVPTSIVRVDARESTLVSPNLNPLSSKVVNIDGRAEEHRY